MSVSALVSARAEGSAGARGRAHRTEVRLEKSAAPALPPLSHVLPVLFAFFALAGRQERQLYNNPPSFSCLGHHGRAGHLDSLAHSMTIMITASVVTVSRVAGASAGVRGIALRNAWGACSLRIRKLTPLAGGLADEGQIISSFFSFLSSDCLVQLLGSVLYCTCVTVLGRWAAPRNCFRGERHA